MITRSSVGISKDSERLLATTYYFYLRSRHRGIQNEDASSIPPGLSHADIGRPPPAVLSLATNANKAGRAANQLYSTVCANEERNIDRIHRGCVHGPTEGTIYDHAGGGCATNNGQSIPTTWRFSAVPRPNSGSEFRSKGLVLCCDDRFLEFALMMHLIHEIRSRGNALSSSFFASKILQ